MQSPEIVEVWRPSYEQDGMGGRERTWSQRPSVMGWVKLAQGRESETGRTSVQQQSATIRFPRNADVAEGDRVVVGGVEYTIDVVDPVLRGMFSTAYGQRVTGGAAS